MAGRLTLPVGVLGLVLLAAGCADDPSVDSASVIDGLAAAVVPEAPEVVSAIDCPQPEEGVVAQTMTCTAAIEGEAITVDLDIDEDGMVAATVQEGLLDLAEVERLAAERLGTDLSVGGALTTDVAIECPGTVVVDRPGVMVECTGTSGGRARALVVEIVDDEGAWTISFAAPE